MLSFGAVGAVTLLRVPVPESDMPTVVPVVSMFLPLPSRARTVIVTVLDPLAVMLEAEVWMTDCAADATCATMSVAVFVAAPVVAVMVVDPCPTVVATPVAALIVATAVLLDVQPTAGLGVAIESPR